MRWLNKLIVPLIVFIAVLSANNIQWGGNHWKDIIEADGKGYYAHLPAVFIFNDLNFSFFDSIEKKHPNPAIYYDYRVNVAGKTCNKYFSGTALAMSPFFLIAHWSAGFLGFEKDGYSKIYLISISFAAIFYLWLGLYYLKKLLHEFSSNGSLISFLLVIFTFGTNLFYYAVCEPAMSHIYSFAFITAFVFYSKKYFESPNSKSVLLLSFFLGVIVLIRPVNGILVFVLPFLTFNWFVFVSGVNFLFKRYWIFLLSILILVSIVGLQLIIYKIQTGQFFVDAYGDESFNWLSPHLIDFLFSYKKGLFLYTPILLLSVYGFIVLYKKSKYRFYTLTFFILLLFYILSSWWNWWYGGSFGTRVLVEYYSLFVLLLLFVIESIHWLKGKTVFFSILVVFMIVSQIQMYQYRYYHIHWEKMDKKHYWNCFLRVDLLAKEINPNKDLLE
ncbi:MAG: hypothetical protein IPP64_04280 [Bacteroidetes bacterium]|nr:hypothetical protein [Bacteroidota bacterium]